MKAASYNQRNNGHRKTLCPGAPQDSARHHKWKAAWELGVGNPERSPGLLLACHTEGTLLRVGGSLSEGLETRAEKPRFIVLAEGDLRACWVSVAQRGVTGACLAHDRQEGTVRTGTKRPQTAVPAWLEWTG